jgi:hypothetical protein
VLDPGDPLFAGEVGELGEVSLAKVFNLIGHCKYSKKANLFTISLKLFESITKCLGKNKSSKQ